MEQVATSPWGDEFLVRIAKPGDYGEYRVVDASGEGDIAVLAVGALDRIIHHGKWRVTVWPWPSKASVHRPPVSELYDSEEAAARRADDLVQQIEQGVLRP